MTDLAMVIKHMSKLIIDQGTILDSIEYNCATTAMQVDEGKELVVPSTRNELWDHHMHSFSCYKGR